MKKLFTFICVALMVMGSWAQVSYDVIPQPRSVQLNPNGEVYVLSQQAVVTWVSGNEKMASNALLLSEYLQADAQFTVVPQADVKRSAKKGAPVGAAITLCLAPAKGNVAKKGKSAAQKRQSSLSDNPDAYQLTVDQNGVTIIGVTEEGVFRGIQTLRKAIGTQGGAQIELPYVTIQDEPRFSYRGVHFDTARHFFPVDFIKTFIDIMALHGCNQFHWHLTEDQGWRFEVKSMPKLAQKGSVRKQTVLGRNAGIYDGQPYGGYYTQEDCREIVAYAAKRYINVIPEIDLPGHMLGALHVYPELGCTGGPYEVWPTWGVSEDVLCAGNPKTLDFLKRVYDELCEVFPSKLIHIGGDESPRVRWKHCPKCQAKMKELGLKNEAELQTYINKEMDKHLTAKGRTLIGWDETLEGGLSENGIVMSWRGMKGGIEAARQHHRVIMTPTDYCYIDYYQLKDDWAQPHGIGGYVPVSKVYSLEPVPSELTEEEAQYILGPQVNLWTEYVGFPEHAMYMLLPRLDAISEVQWLPKEQKNYETFKQRLGRMEQLYDRLGYKYCHKTE
ncbi:MAG: beta-N-acetylhexosaminidase [Bacteroidaceae bacterium]|nr:beta-N-acetylhexosaminidase [Bacteroidaceae bacterium]